MKRPNINKKRPGFAHLIKTIIMSWIFKRCNEFANFNVQNVSKILKLGESILASKKSKVEQHVQNLWLAHLIHISHSFFLSLFSPLSFIVICLSSFSSTDFFFLFNSIYPLSVSLSLLHSILSIFLFFYHSLFLFISCALSPFLSFSLLYLPFFDSYLFLFLVLPFFLSLLFSFPSHFTCFLSLCLTCLETIRR